MNPGIPTERSMSALRTLTPARVGLGCTGASLPTRALLEFALDHARARDAVHAAFDREAIIADLSRLGLTALPVASRAVNRSEYLRRPDLGRRLNRTSAAQLSGRDEDPSAPLAIVIGDGLSPRAVHAHAVELMRALLPQLAGLSIETGTVAVATGARVALGDEIGEIVAARMVLVLIGERPGLSAPHSLGAYLTYAPKVGRSDAERNCVSNIHGGGLSYQEAGFKIAWLVREGFRRELTGVALKDESGNGWQPAVANGTGHSTNS